MFNSFRAPSDRLAGAVLPEGSSGDLFIARQPIFDRAGDVYGYELLFRSSRENHCDMEEGNTASSHTINVALHTIGLDALVGKKKLFVNLTRQLLLDEVYTILPSEQTVIEVLELVTPDPDLMAACRKLRAAGYELALDDYVPDDVRRPMIELANVLKFDFAEVTPSARKDWVEQLPPDRPALLAEKVETRTQAEQALAQGFDYLQGYFYCTPQVVSGRPLTGNQALMVNFLQELSRPQLDYDRLEELTKQDVALSHNLLRYLNSAAIGLPHRITSLKQAMALIGERGLRKWGWLMAVTTICEDKPREPLSTSLSRARFGELMVERENLPEHQLDMFLIGMFSCIDAMLQRPLHEILHELPAMEQIQAVLCNEPNANRQLRRIYQLTLACERGDWGEVTALSSGLHQSQSELAVNYYQALSWANAILNQVVSV